MEYRQAVRRRRMVRSFDATPLDPDVVERLLTDAVRSPTAGHARGTAVLVLEGPGTRAYWEATTDATWRGRSRRWPGLSAAPVVVLSLACPDVYLRRYADADKAASGLGASAPGGRGADAWPVPYWWGDAAFGVMTLLLGAADAGLGACFLGNFRGERRLLDDLGVPGEWRLFGAVVLGRPAGDDARSASLDRPGPDPTERVHRGRWQGDR
jgi:nitroreductase